MLSEAPSRGFAVYFFICQLLKVTWFSKCRQNTLASPQIQVNHTTFFFWNVQSDLEADCSYILLIIKESLKGACSEQIMVF
jgi:hypothetical protein